jgi:thiamine-phosphate pyrophosphorylase
MGGRLPRIWLVTMPDSERGPILPIREALRGSSLGRVGVQLRAKRVADRQLVAWAHELRDVTSTCGVPMTVNGRPDVAQIAHADGVHLPERGLSVSAVRSEWPDLSLVGVSRHDHQGLREAEADGADFAFLSPVFDVPDKGRPLGVRGFSTSIANVGIPTYALGGITVANARTLLDAGAWGIAVRRAVYDAGDPRRALETLLAALDKGGATGE